jgi:hypothetical protein
LYFLWRSVGQTAAGLRQQSHSWLQFLRDPRPRFVSPLDVYVIRNIQRRMFCEEVKVKIRPTVSRPVHLGVGHPSGTRDQFFFLLEIFFRLLRVFYFVAPFLSWGRVCNLLLLLVIARAVPRDSRPYFIVPILETPPTWRARSPYLYQAGTGWPRYTLGHCVPPFRRLLRLAGLRWLPADSSNITLQGPHRKNSFQ